MVVLRLGSTGPYVKLIQSLLTRIGYNPGAVDGIYGIQTKNAVMAYQRDNNLYPDGIVGPMTWQSFLNILKGYDNYIIQPNDTLYNIARKYYTSVNAIITANPGINPNNLTIGESIIVPYGIEAVFTDIDYTYKIMEMDIMELKVRYPFIEVGVVGKSVLGNNLYYIKLGSGPNQVFYNGAHHALEWITSPLLMKFIENFSKAYSNKESIRGYNIQNIWEKSSIYIIPMVNPDGVDLCLEGLEPTNPYYYNLLEWNDTGLPFSLVWEANIRGVDLNLNYPAGWEEAKALEDEFGVFGPGPTGYGGEAPLSEPETISLVDFTLNKHFRLTISYHSQGRVIYWTYKGLEPPESKKIAEVFSRVSGYSLAEPPLIAAYAGYKDWFIDEFRRPGFTIEVGIGENPLPIEQFNTIYNENEEILLVGAVI